MPDATRRQPGRGSEGWIVGGGLVGLVAAVWVAVELGSRADGVNPQLSWNPWTVIFGLIFGRLTWPATATWILAGLAAVAVVLIVLAVVLSSRRSKKATRVDWAAQRMGRGREIATILRPHAQQTAARLGVDGIGIPLGRTVVANQPAFASFEEMVTMIAGPRVGKTTSLVVPAILEAVGAVLVTSNKSDVLATTRRYRAERGTVWTFDPQKVANEPATWWWNPLSYVVDDEKAAKLAAHFAAAGRPVDAKKDAYFDPAGENLLAGMLLAAAIGKRPVTDVFSWLTDETNDEPAEILETSTYPLIAREVRGVLALDTKQRGGVYNTAAQMASCLKSSAIAKWVTPPAEGEARTEFRPENFVRSTDTLFSLSKEGAGSAGPLVLALTAAVVEAAEEYAVTQGGRLPVPMLGVLDEAANVCRWRQLPDLYSHYGSRGINLVTILQSWSQGSEVWGAAGMKKLWSASNVKVYAGGVDEVDFLEQLAKNIGDYHYRSRSVSSGRSGGSVSTSSSRERILDVADLAALPRGRAVVLSSGAKPTLLRLVPWFEGSHAAEVKLLEETRA